jgi:transcriptional regulator with XRE-family HTH domain
MRLDDYLVRKGISTADFARAIGVTYHAVYYWRRGETVPGTKQMQKILELTEGKVRPNDFFTMPGKKNGTC